MSSNQKAAYLDLLKFLPLRRLHIWSPGPAEISSNQKAAFLDLLKFLPIRRLHICTTDISSSKGCVCGPAEISSNKKAV
jgi:hypothetical protein